MNKDYTKIKLEQTEVLKKYNLTKSKKKKSKYYKELMEYDKKLEELKNGRI